MRRQKKYMKFLQICVLCMLLLIPATVYGATEYSEGYFHYEIEDDSISITGYFGTESEVSVPSMIAGYPVSKIAQGAFAGTTVKTLQLPDTIMTIEQQAIDAGITVEYAGQMENPDNGNPDAGDSDSGNPDSGNTDTTQNGDTGTGSTESGDDADAEESGSDSAIGGAADGNQGDSTTGGTTDLREAEVNLPEEGTQRSVGIVAAKQTVISVDADKHLISTDTDNKVTVLDDTEEYTQETLEDGTVKIADSKGREITLDDEENAIIPAQQTSESQSSSSVIIVVAVIVLVLLAAAGAVSVYLKKKKQK